LKGKRTTKNVKNLTIDDYVEGILNSDITILSRAITLVESNLPEHNKLAQELLSRIIPYAGNSIRVGITGSPGVGKSTFIEQLGLYLCEKGHKVAVLAVDPSSTISRGSILGDKTRMGRLANHPNAFIRPSPSGGVLGGVARKTRESILLCEAAGFDVVFVETVGVGQSEVLVRSMVDFFLLLILPGGGDELQGFKKGSVELADAIVINKADGDNLNLAKITQREYRQAIHYLSNATESWETKILLASALNNVGIKEVWEIIQEFKEKTTKSGIFQVRRREQTLEWFYSLIKETLLNSFFQHPKVANILPELEEKIFTGKLTPTLAVEQLMNEVKNENFIGNK
jgi:LAO/AO transport system kinase